jgi:dTDP-4-amino-4,6-dideoxygalactose transaminase
VIEPGLNLRPTEIAAALARSRMIRVPGEIAARRALLGEYRRALEPLGVRLAFEAGEDARSAGHIAAAIFATPARAEAAARALEAARIQSSHHYWPLHRFAAYGGGASATLPRAEAFAARELTLPLFPAMTGEDVALVARVIAAA